MQTKEISDKGKELLKKISRITKGKVEWILPLIFLSLVLYSIYIWYAYAFNSSWNEAKKNEYVNMKQRDVVFEKEKFDAVILKIKNRKEEYGKNIESAPDIFRLK